MTLGEKIQKARKQRNLLQEELAGTVGINKAHLSRLENGRYSPSADVLKKIAEALQVSADYLLSESDDNPREVKIEDQSLAERVGLLNSLEGKDRETVINVIDAVLTKKRMMNVLAEKSAIMST